jgi:hypothetical protein
MGVRSVMVCYTGAIMCRLMLSCQAARGIRPGAASTLSSFDSDLDFAKRQVGRRAVDGVGNQRAARHPGLRRARRQAPDAARLGRRAGPHDEQRRRLRLPVLERWVEQNIAPDRITGTTVTRTRPLCPNRLVARCNGSGSVDDAASFTCTTP